ncbi:9874_t:CDS:2 [Cetraspora pellucida]|uniref:9874_t:CDS:1 n=1 Tax=Cetraspora pellucida TaxID=1433469 RepID=A0A9N9B500_9GLOM|nr:9874_t:CDS:2 [Cetraspora pellucida]
MYEYESFDKLQKLILHYASLDHQISYAISCHVHLGFNIAQGSDIELAIEGIHGTSVAHLESEHPKGKKQNEFTSAKLEKLQKKDIQKPNPQVSQHSVPKSS